MLGVVGIDFGDIKKNVAIGFKPHIHANVAIAEWHGAG